MKLVKVKQSFYDLIAENHVENEIMFNEAGRPCVLIVRLKYKGNDRKFVVPLRSNISSRTPARQYFPLPPGRNTRDGNHHGVHYIKIFPIEDEYIDRFRISGRFYEIIMQILNRNQARIIQDCQEYLKECEEGKKHPMTPDLDGIIEVLAENKHDGTAQPDE